MPRCLVLLGVLAMTWSVAGCAEDSGFSSSLWDPFGLARVFGPQQEPVRIGLTHEERGVFDVRQWGRTAPWHEFAQQLSKELGRPVVIENLKPFQIEFHLNETKRLDFALITASDYVGIREEGQAGQVLAISAPRTRQGVIVAKADSGIQTLEDLKGQRFAFGPNGDEVLHKATVALLEESGVPPKELMTLIPGIPQCHISSKEAAKEIAYGIGTSAGVIEAEEFDAYPETGGKWSLFDWYNYSKDQFRELGRTPEVRIETMGAGPFVAGDHTDQELVAAVRGFLLGAREEHPEALHDLGFSRFRAPPADPDDEIKRLAAAAGAVP